MTYDATLKQSYWNNTVDHFCYNTNGVIGYSDSEGALDKLLGHVLGTEVSGATTSGSGSGPYTATLNTPVGLGRAVVNYAIGGVSYTAQDPGDGTITGVGISSCSVTHATGAFTVTFTSTPDANPTVDYLYGNPGADWRAVVNRTARDGAWTEWTEPWPTASDTNGMCKEVILHNTGKDGTDNILIGIREAQYPSGNFYAWSFNGYLMFTDSNMHWNHSYHNHGMEDYNSTQETWNRHPMIPFIDSGMSYWITSNQQRIMGAFKVQSDYSTYYLGFGNRAGSQDNYPCPLMIKGMYWGTYNYTVDYFRYIPEFYSNTSGTNMIMVLPNNEFFYAIGSGIAAFGVYLYPKRYSTGVSVLTKGPSGHVFSVPVYAAHARGDAVYMDLDGVRMVLSTAVVSEDILRGDDGNRYRIFQNWRDQDYDDFVAIQEGTYTTTTTTTT